MTNDSGPRTLEDRAARGSWAARGGRAARVGWAARGGRMLLLAPFVLAACAGAESAVQPSGSLGPGSPSGPLSVFAAASLSDVLDDLGERWAASHPEVALVTTVGASNVLATQITEGAHADVFLSADRQRPAELAEAGLTSGEPVIFALNRLVIVAPRDSDRVIGAMDIARPGVQLVAAGAGVPITRYADEIVARLASEASDPEAFQESVAANVVSREDNVRAALAKVELGEADAAIVYATDAQASGDVRVIALPETVEVTAEYAAVPIGDGAAAEFIDWLRGPEAAGILAAAGFEPVPG